MDVMQLRRGLMMQMASGGHVRMASGEFTQVSGVAYLDHNLGTKKILVIMQRVNSDHSNVDADNQFRSLMIFGATVEALQLDEEQTYSLNGGTKASFDSTNITTQGVYPKGLNAYFPATTGTYPSYLAMSYAVRGVTAEDRNGASDNTVRIYPTYGMIPGRWVWRAYALD